MNSIMDCDRAAHIGRMVPVVRSDTLRRTGDTLRLICRGFQGASTAAWRPSKCFRDGHDATWSLTRPQASIAAYTVVGPTKRKPAFLRALASAVASGTYAGTSAKVFGARLRAGRWDH